MRQFVFFGILICVAAALVVRSEVRPAPRPADHFIDQSVTITGRISTDPDVRESQIRLVVQTTTINSENIHTKVLVSTSPYQNYRFGDTVVVSGRLRQPENFITDAGREFNYVQYLSKDGIYYQMSFADIQIKDQRNKCGRVRREGLAGVVRSESAACYAGLKSVMYKLRKRFVTKIDQLYHQPEGGLLAGVLFGEQSGLGIDLQDNFRRTGVIHIVVLSGFNVTIVAIFIVWLLSRLMHPRTALVFGIIGIILFVILVGAGPTIVRAGIMAILAIIARLTGRDADAGRSLLIAGLMMVIENPSILIHDISFQLSFLATMGIIYVAPVLERHLPFIPEALTLRETVVSTLAAQIFVTPFLLYTIGELSIVSPLVNVLVVPLVPISMLLGFVSALLGLMWVPLGSVVMILTYTILHIQIKIVEWFGALKFASITVPEFPFWMVLVVYVLLCLTFVFANSDDHDRINLNF